MGYYEQFIYAKNGNIKKIIPYLQEWSNNDEPRIDIFCGAKVKQNIKINKTSMFGNVIPVNVNIPKGTEGIIVGCNSINSKGVIPLKYRDNIEVIFLDHLSDFNYSSIFEDQEFKYKGKKYFAPLKDSVANNKIDYVEDKNYDDIYNDLEKSDECDVTVIKKETKEGAIISLQRSNSSINPIVKRHWTNREYDKLGNQIHEKPDYSNQNDKNKVHEVLFTFDGTETRFSKQPYPNGYIIINADSTDDAIKTFRKTYGTDEKDELLCSEYYVDSENIEAIKNRLGPCYNYIDLTKPKQQADNISNSEEQSSGRK